MTAFPSPSHAEGQPDTDEDGIPNRVERRTGTDPFERDTDGDGVPDGIEDRNRDGEVDEDETDPRVYGLFPGAHPHIPEPMVFDLVRGLGAKRGELESNALVLVNARSGRVGWAPEVEYAFADGYALELELPLVDRHLEAIKLAVQGTLPNGHSSNFTHGWQTFAEVSLDDGTTDGVLVYMFGHRFSAMWSYLTIIGAKSTFSDVGLSQTTGLLNASLFASPSELVTLGLESNTSIGAHGAWSVRLFPQIHVQISRHARIQLAAGIDVSEDRVDPMVGTRLIMED